MRKNEQLGYGLLGAMALFGAYLFSKKGAAAATIPEGTVTVSTTIPYYGTFGAFEPVPSKGYQVTGKYSCPVGYGLWKRSTDGTWWCYPIVGPSGIPFQPVGSINVDQGDFNIYGSGSPPLI